MSDSVRPHRRQPTRLPRPWDSPGKITGVGCHFLFQCVKVKSLSRVRLLAAPWTAAHQAPPSMRFSRQEYWSGLPLPSLEGNLESPKIRKVTNLRVIYMNEINFGLNKFKKPKNTPGRPSSLGAPLPASGLGDRRPLNQLSLNLASSWEAGAGGHRAAVLQHS